ncbi:NADPH-dependent FMN reductase [Paenibacillus sedimenti]|uniref:NAD(P)H-dependent oxidoreductase n=1 Tax=Paenibacillus sedimenti TaxID=2770274 RepID=A0A926KQH4_9BACL|nr:NADPH-dependent FMN reductase [Paenibacillus sedimenti]MBD0380468.1 NAD(P)H-dependent oxidoreductase [Paenibacillus sedimenti]
MEKKGQGIRIIGLCGSTRAGSYNRAILQTAATYFSRNVSYMEADITMLPFYNQDLEANLPESVVHFVELVKSADGLLISTPEYNYSLPGILKNALEWGSRPTFDFPLNEKPVAIIGASRGMFGPVRSHMHLRDVLFGCNAAPISRPEVYINYSSTKIDANGNVTDESTITLLKTAVEELTNQVVAKKRVNEK